MTTLINQILITRIKRSRLRRGVTLLEVTIVLLIAVSIIAAALYASSSTITQREVLEEIETLNGLAAAVQKIKTKSGYPPSEEILSTLKTLNLLPARLALGGAGNIRSQWRTRIFIYQEGNGAGFSLNYDPANPIPAKECKLFVSAVKSGILKSFGNGIATKNLVDMTSDDVVAACAAGGPTFSTVFQ